MAPAACVPVRADAGSGLEAEDASVLTGVSTESATSTTAARRRVIQLLGVFIVHTYFFGERQGRHECPGVNEAPATALSRGRYADQARSSAAAIRMIPFRMMTAAASGLNTWSSPGYAAPLQVRSNANNGHRRKELTLMRWAEDRVVPHQSCRIVFPANL